MKSCEDRAKDIADLYNSRDYGKEYRARFDDWERQNQGGN